MAKHPSHNWICTMYNVQCTIVQCETGRVLVLREPTAV